MDDRLKQLMDYTKFHIGMYVTLVSVLVGFVSKDYATLVSPPLPLLAVDNHLPTGRLRDGWRVDSQRRSPITFLVTTHSINSTLGPWGAKWIRARECTHLEHTTFWLAAVNAVVGLIVEQLHTEAWALAVGRLFQASPVLLL